ncbi:MAG TPA: hypothetical protein DD670_12355 [Planctomycetaceae bacterium]|nr:hypothetical protein [Planctomycetaceae bacterium]
MLFGVISFFGEGLHYLPGCGHEIRLPGGTIMVGFDHRADGGLTLDPIGGISAASGSGNRVLAPGDCTICSLLAAAKQAGRPILFSAVSEFVTATTAEVALSPLSMRALSFDARAPPA